MSECRNFFRATLAFVLAPKPRPNRPGRTSGVPALQQHHLVLLHPHQKATVLERSLGFGAPKKLESLQMLEKRKPEQGAFTFRGHETSTPLPSRIQAPWTCERIHLHPHHHPHQIDVSTAHGVHPEVSQSRGRRNCNGGALTCRLCL